MKIILTNTSFHSKERIFTIIILTSMYFLFSSVMYAVPSSKLSKNITNGLGKKTVVNNLQEILIHGTVTDINGVAIPGLNVYVTKDSEGGIANIINATTSDSNGNYSLKVDIGNFLVVTGTGLKTEIIKIIEGKIIYNFTLDNIIGSLDEVLVIGYGSVKKSDLTGAISSVKLNENDALQNNSLNSLLQGRVAGLEVTGNSGTPGAALSVRIRGTNSLRSDNEPLYVVDGVIMSSSTEDTSSPFNTVNDFQAQQSGLVGINPSDVDNIQVLKDASATAIYGSRGANGVIIITTKKGSTGKAKIMFSTSLTATVLGNTIDLLGADDYTDMANKGALLRNTVLKYGFFEGNIYSIKNLSNPNSLFADLNNPTLTSDQISQYGLKVIEKVNWIDEIAKTGLSKVYRLSVRGGEESIKYYLATGINNQEGVLPNSNSKTGDIRINIDGKVSERVKIQSALAATYQTNRMDLASDGTGTSGLMNAVLSGSPVRDDFFDFDGEPVPSPDTWLTDYVDQSKQLNVLASLRTDIKLSKIFTYQLKLGANIRNKERVRFFTDRVGMGTSRGGFLGESNLASTNYTVENLLQFEKKISKRHDINGTLGYTMEEQRSITKSFFGNDFSDFILAEKGLSFARNITYNNTTERPRSILSAFARFNYTLDKKYLFTYTFRRDGVSVFSEDNKWANFQSFAFAWKMQKEKFIEDLNIFKELKLRAGWGQTGNSNIAPFQTLALYNNNQGSGIDGSTVIGITPTGIPNPNLVWETTIQRNFGLDWGIMNGRFSGTIDIYQKNTVDLLLNKAIPPSNGFTFTTVNIGEIENKGLEFSIDANIIRDKDFKWTLGGNISFNRNKIVDLGDENSFGDGRTHFFGNPLGTNSFTSPVNIFIENEALGLFWGLETNGLYKTNDELINAPVYSSVIPVLGDIRFVDQNGDGVIDASDRKIIGNPNPDYFYGFNTEVSYKNFALRLVFTGKQGNDILNAKMATNGYNDKLFSVNVYKEAWEDRWTPDNVNAQYPRQGYSLKDAADVLIEDGSYFKLATINLSYNLPKELTKAINIDGASIYFTGNNIFTLTHYRGFDPDVNSFTYDPTRIGIDWASSPTPRSFTLGINFNF